MNLRSENSLKNKQWVDLAEKVVYTNRYSIFATCDMIHVGKKLSDMNSKFYWPRKATELHVKGYTRPKMWAEKTFENDLDNFTQLDNIQVQNNKISFKKYGNNVTTETFKNKTKLNSAELPFKHEKSFKNLFLEPKERFFVEKATTLNSTEVSRKRAYKYLVFGEPFEPTRYAKRSISVKLPLRVIKLPEVFVRNKITQKFEPNRNSEHAITEIFKMRYDSTIKKIEIKPSSMHANMVFKQKKYTRKKEIGDVLRFYKTNFGVKLKNLKSKTSVVLKPSKYFEASRSSHSRMYRLVKKSRVRVEDLNIVTSRRLLRTTKTLTVPVNVNLTVITNSYDVIHS